MNKRQVRKAIQQNRYSTFTGSAIPLLENGSILGDDLVSLIKRLNSDCALFSTHTLGRLQCVIKSSRDGRMNLNWVVIAGEQGNLFAEPNSGLEEGSMQELQDKLFSVTREVVDSIDFGNDLAHEISQNGITSEELLKRLHSAPNKQVARKVAARATGPQVSFAFSEGERQLGGNLPVSKEFTNDETMLIDNCRVVRRINKKEIRLWVDSPPADLRLSPYFIGNEFIVRAQQGTDESSILDCASLAEADVNIEVSHGLLLKNEKHVLQLAKIRNHASILKAAQLRLNELYHYQEN